MQSKIHKITKLSKDISEIIIYSETGANNFQPGQFFRLQNLSNNQNENIEPVAVTAFEVNHEQKLLSFVIQNVGKSSHLACNFKESDNIILMGPTGSPTKILSDKNILLIGGGIGNALLIPVAKALKENNCDISFVSGYTKHSDLIYAEKIEEFADNVLRSFLYDLDNSGTIIDALGGAKANGLLENIDHIYCNGSNDMMQAIMDHKKSLFPDIEFHEGIVLNHEITGDKIFLIHGHQVDFKNYKIWRLSNILDRKSTRLNSSHITISYAVFCLKKKINPVFCKTDRIRIMTT